MLAVYLCDDFVAGSFGLSVVKHFEFGQDFEQFSYLFERGLLEVYGRAILCVELREMALKEIRRLQRQLTVIQTFDDASIKRFHHDLVHLFH